MLRVMFVKVTLFLCFWLGKVGQITHGKDRKTAAIRTIL